MCLFCKIIVNVIYTGASRTSAGSQERRSGWEWHKSPAGPLRSAVGISG